jgi:D-alanine-D-alanine ligase
MANARKNVAVCFGGRSPEHDVSVLTGLQVLGALDPALYDGFPVYVSPQGLWYVGDALRRRDSYIPGPSELGTLTQVSLHFGDGQLPSLMTVPKGLLHRSRRIHLDFAIPAFHGLYGEDGCVQGLFETAGLAYSGMRVLAASVFMDKVATKHILSDTSIRQLPYESIPRPREGLIITPDELSANRDPISFPCCAKPAHLGSSIGVAKADNLQELADVLPAIFRLDPMAIVEPFVQNLVEYNVSVARINGETRTSAIEQPKTNAVLLDFKEKYRNGAKKLGQSEGMLSLTREINPSLSPDIERSIREWATEAYERLGGTGAPRIDFLCNSESGELWLNEVNPTPGSFAYFLWEAAQPPIPFSTMLDHLIAEGIAEQRGRQLPHDPVPKEAQLLKRR